MAHEPVLNTLHAGGLVVSRRIGILGLFFCLLFAVVLGQSLWIQYFHAPALNVSAFNRVSGNSGSNYPRGDIVAADGSVLAHSLPVGSSTTSFTRVYPDGSLMSGLVGFSSSQYGRWALESQYNDVLTAHAQPPQSWAQVLAPSQAADTLTLTVQPALQQIARVALAGRDGAGVAIDPRNGGILAMYANPSYDPTPLTAISSATQVAAWKSYTTNNAHGFPPLGLLATQQTFPPGSTFKVITTAAAAVSKPELMVKSYPYAAFARLPDTNKLLYNSGGSACGGTVQVMLPESCDPGYGLLGMDLGRDIMSAQATAFGYNTKIPLDLPGVVSSYFPAASVFLTDRPGLAYSAIGQKDVRATALENALVAAAIANGGTAMTPHLMATITAPDGTLITRYRPTAWLKPLKAVQAAQIVPLMRGVVTRGTASGVGFHYGDQVAAKTGTAQTGNAQANTDDWMIAFAPANNPVVAIAVVVPFQATSETGASIAGPIVKCVVEGALALSKGLPPTGTRSTCPH